MSLSVVQWVHCTYGRVVESARGTPGACAPVRNVLTRSFRWTAAGAFVRLTAKERILIHLAEFAKYVEVAEVPPEIGQEGIARAAGVYLQHVRQFIDPLMKDGLVRERLAHVVGHRRRLKVYDLTDAGRQTAVRLRQQVGAEPIRVRDAQGVRDATVGELLREAKGAIPLGTIVRAAMDGETLDLSVPASAAKGMFVERLSELPRTDSFVGRHTELDVLTGPGPSPRFFVVRGVAGIGKSSLAAKACERLRGTRNLFWHRVRPWDSRETILADLAAFFAQLGRPGLRAVLASEAVGRADAILREDLAGTASFLVFDDVHEGPSEVHAFLRFLKDALQAAPDVRVLILTRVSVPSYDRRDVSVSGLVREIDLGGLDPRSIGEMLAREPDAPALRPLAERLGGHPLFLELLRSAGRADVRKGALRDVRRFIEEEIYGSLPDRERRMMKLASLYEVPVPREALFFDEKMSHDVVLALQDRSLLQPMGSDAFGAHDTIREFFASVSTPAEREGLSRFAVEQLRRIASREQEAGNSVGGMHCLSNAVRLATGETEAAVLWELLGDAQERIGDLPAALTGFKEAARRTADSESIARLHRKTAAALILRGRSGDAASEIEAGYRALGDRPSGERGWFDLLQARTAVAREEWGVAREHGQSALATFQAVGDALGQVHSLLELAQVEMYSLEGDPTQAERSLSAALELARATGTREFQVRIHIVLANLCANRIGDIRRATGHWEAVDAMKDSIQDPFIQRSFLMMKGWFSLYQNADTRSAEDHFAQALALGRRVHDPAALAFAGYGLANVSYYDGQIETAREAFERCVSNMDALGLLADAMEARWMVAECCLRLGDTPGFLRMATDYRDPKRRAAAMARPVHATVLEGLEAVLRRDFPRCDGLFGEALKTVDRRIATADPMMSGFVHFFYGVSLEALGRLEAGTEQVRTAYAILEANGLRAPLDLLRSAESRIVTSLRAASGP